jgi:hypothetical protein
MNRVRKIILSLLTISFIIEIHSFQFPSLDYNSFNQPTDTSCWYVAKEFKLGNSDQITGFAYTPDGEKVIASTQSREISLLNLSTGVVEWSIKFSETNDQYPVVQDIHPNGSEFLVILKSESGEAPRRVFFLSTKDGKLLRKTAEEDSKFFQAKLNIDHRKPSPAEIKEREETGLAPNWHLLPYYAKYVKSGSQIISLYTNTMTGPNLYDRVFILHDAKTTKPIWRYQIVADKENFDSDQPGGFKNSIPFPSILEKKDQSGFYYGTPHARIHILDEKVVKKNENKKDIEEMEAPLVFANPLSINSSYDNLAMPIRSLDISEDQKNLWVSAGEGGEHQVYAIDTKKGMSIFRSPVFNWGKARIATDNKTLAVTGTNSGYSLWIVNSISGKLQFSGFDLGFNWNPKYKEGIIGGTSLQVLKEASIKKVKLADSWQMQNIFLTEGTMIQIFGIGKIEISTKDNVPDGDRWSFDDTKELLIGPQGRKTIQGSEEGRVYLRGEGEVSICGGLTEAEFKAKGIIDRKTWK